MIENLVDRYKALFTGNARSHGAFYPGEKKGSSMETKVGSATTEEYLAHLNGETGVGVVPIMDDDKCYFGAIDIDAHGDAPDIDLVDLEKRVRSLDLPLTVCRSKSGGAHLYLFGSEPIKASIIRSALAKWADLLGHAGCEVFPKQSTLPVDGNGDRQLGNWINLCYFDAMNDDQLRYCFEGGQSVSLAYFIELAESRKISPALLVERSDTDHNGAPPCIQKMITNGVPGGARNEALYNITIYCKKAYPESWRDKAMDLNATVFDEPLPHAEAKKTITSAGRRDYKYRCGQEPCKSNCRSQICVTRKHGITEDEKAELEIGKQFEYKNLRKLQTDPVKWLIEVEGTDIILSTPELMDFRQVRNAVAERLTKLAPPMKNDRWQVMLHKMMGEATEIEAPDEASTSGVIRSRLNDFIRKANLHSDGKTAKDRDMLMMGSPVVQERDGERVVYFRGPDFVSYLKKNRAEELKGANLWLALREAGVQHCRLRVRKSPLQVWYVPLTDDNILDLESMEIPSEF